MQQSVVDDEANSLTAVNADAAASQPGIAVDTAQLETAVVGGLSGSSAYRLNQAVLDDAEEGIYGLDENGFVTFVNPAAQRMTGWSTADLKGRTQHSMVHHSRCDGSHYPVEECPIYQVLRDGTVQHRSDEVFWRKDGTCFPVSYTSTPVRRNGRPCGAVIVFSDISLRVQDRAWQKSKARVMNSLRQRAPILETVSCIVEAFGIFIGAHRSQRGRGLVRYPH